MEGVDFGSPPSLQTVPVAARRASRAAARSLCSTHGYAHSLAQRLGYSLRVKAASDNKNFSIFDLAVAS